MLSQIFTHCVSELCKSYSLGVTRDESLQYGASRTGARAAGVDQVNCKTVPVVLGLGMGGWASIKTMDEKVKEFELFDRCNGC